jgi:hypothetical protein
VAGVDYARLETRADFRLTVHKCLQIAWLSQLAVGHFWVARPVSRLMPTGRSGRSTKQTARAELRYGFTNYRREGIDPRVRPSCGEQGRSETLRGTGNARSIE